MILDRTEWVKRKALLSARVNFANGDYFDPDEEVTVIGYKDDTVIILKQDGRVVHISHVSYNKIFFEGFYA